MPISGSVAVTGTFWQTTCQPISGTVGISGTVPDSGTFWQATQPISGTVTAGQGTAAALAGAWPTELTDGTHGPAAVKAASTAALATDPALVVAVSPNNAVAVTGTFWQATQPVSGSVSVSNFPGTQPISGTVTSNQGTANTLANAWPTELTDGTHGPAAIKAASTAAIATDPALVVAVSPNNSVAVTGTFWQATQPISGTVTANQGGSNWSVNLTQIAGSALALGQAAMAASLPVTIASNQSAVPVSGTFWQTTQPVSGTVGVSGSVAVTGTFWQATQPISGTVTVSNADVQYASGATQATPTGTVALGKNSSNVLSALSIDGSGWPQRQRTDGRRRGDRTLPQFLAGSTGPGVRRLHGIQFGRHAGRRLRDAAAARQSRGFDHPGEHADRRCADVDAGFARQHLF